MIGAIIGDIVGSQFEFINNKSKRFNLFTDSCKFTDDSILTIAVAYALTICKEDYGDLKKVVIRSMKFFCDKYKDCNYGNMFVDWLETDGSSPYNSYGNGAAMRISPVGLAAKSIDEVKLLSKIVTEVTHNHPEGLKGAEAVAIAVYMANNGSRIEEIKTYINNNYYRIDFTIDDIRDTNRFKESCQITVPQAFQSFFESHSFEDAIRNAVSIGGDSDTIAAICGGIAGAYYGVDDYFRSMVMTFLDTNLYYVINQFENKYLSCYEN